MTTKQDSPQRAEQARAEHDAQESGLLEAVVRDNVLFDLGRPDGLFRVQVAAVGASRFRVNVFVGDNAASARVAHSYFVHADGNGKILSSFPAVARLY
jgi:hypothetical protein